jgi:hypothetical protein
MGLRQQRRAVVACAADKRHVPFSVQVNLSVSDADVHHNDSQNYTTPNSPCHSMLREVHRVNRRQRRQGVST